MEKHHRIEVLLWSIALPGFGLIILNGKFLKGLLLIGLEILINVQSNLNEVIISSFHGHITEAIFNTNYQWLLFYPCIYMFAHIKTQEVAIHLILLFRSYSVHTLEQSV
jgi:hypothetical protein